MRKTFASSLKQDLIDFLLNKYLKDAISDFSVSRKKYLIIYSMVGWH